MGGEAAPAVVAGGFDHAGAEGVGLDVAEDRQEVVVVLDDGALEPALPDVAAAVVAAVVALGVGDEQALHDPADRRLAGADQQMDVVGHEAVAVELERLPLLQVGEGLEEGGVVVVVEEDRCAVVAAVDDVVDEPVVDGSQAVLAWRQIIRSVDPDQSGRSAPVFSVVLFPPDVSRSRPGIPTTSSEPDGF